MSTTREPSAASRSIEDAAREVARARGRFASTLGALQYRLKPGTLMNNAWEGVREKSGEVADTTLQTVKDRPLAVSGVIAGIAVFLAREPLWRYASSLLSRDGDKEPTDTIQAHLDHDQGYDLTAPAVKRSSQQGVNA